jgi:outer membrane protein OmpA-like peptidoglycan-associated protein
MHRLLMAAALGLTAAFAVPAHGLADTQVLGLNFETRDLVFETADLVFTVQDIEGAAIAIAGLVENLRVTESETEIRIEVSGDLLFDFDKADIRFEAEPVLKGIADVLKRHPGATVTIAGYTDAKGAGSYNLALSAQRAAAVKSWLVSNGGVNGANLTIQGFGEADPVAPNTSPDGSDDPEGRQKNRRVEIQVQK